MRIGLDVSGAIGRPSGLRRYAEGLLQGFAAAGGDHEFFVYAAKFQRAQKTALTQIGNRGYPAPMKAAATGSGLASPTLLRIPR